MYVQHMTTAVLCSCSLYVQKSARFLKLDQSNTTNVGSIFMINRFHITHHRAISNNSLDALKESRDIN